jgi:uncharacterized protein (TIGR02646 family)
MIRVKKPARPPAVLRTQGRSLTKSLCKDYDTFSADYCSGTRKFDFDAAIYGDESVKNALREAQHGKCCFCEAKITHIAYGDVEHFRPKAGYRQHPNSPLSRPGYYWLAYEWANLLLCCQICNQRHKRNLFPLQDPAQRATVHTNDLAKEQPLFINPATVDPALYIEFREEVAYPIDDNPMGRATINGLQLNRDELCQRRLTVLELLVALKESQDLLAHELAEGTIADARLRKEWRRRLKCNAALFRKHQQDSAEYAAMARAFLNQFFVE